MTWRRRVNSVLTTTTGYRLEKAGGRVAPPPPPPPPVAKPAAPKPPPQLPKDMDEDDRKIIEDVRPWTMTSPDKLYALIRAARHVARHGIEGDIVECGVWRGGSMQAAAHALLAEGDAERHLHLFDTYEGMPPPTERDVRVSDGTAASELLEQHDRDSKVWAVAGLDDVRAGMDRIGYPMDRVHFVPGMVEDTVPAHAPQRIAILRLDTDWYESTRHELEHLYPRLVPGGILLIDDYGHWQGSRTAVDEFLESTGQPLLLLRMSSGRVAVKP